MNAAMKSVQNGCRSARDRSNAGISGSRTPGRIPAVSAQTSSPDAMNTSTTVSHTRLPVSVA